MSLYVTEAEIARMLFGDHKDAASLWKEWAPKLEAKGLPQVDPRFRRRYWPAVQAYFERLNGLSDRIAPAKADGEERLKCPVPRSRPPASAGTPERTNVLSLHGSHPGKPGS